MHSDSEISLIWLQDELGNLKIIKDGIYGKYTKRNYNKSCD